jgi:hypothetical protein
MGVSGHDQRGRYDGLGAMNALYTQSGLFLGVSPLGVNTSICMTDTQEGHHITQKVTLHMGKRI